MKWLLFIGSVVIAIALGVWCWLISNDVARARIISKTHDNVSKIATLEKKDNKGAYYLDISESKTDTVRHFREYVRLNKNTIRIFLGD